MTEEERYAQLRSDSWVRALHCFGTAFLFERRAQKLQNRVQLLAFFGLVSPLTVGAAVLGYGVDSRLVVGLVPVAALAAVIQIILSLWGLSRAWSPSLAYAVESMSANRELFDAFQRLGERPPVAVSDLQVQYDLLVERDRFRTSQDDKAGISEAEKRMGMRAALRQLRKACSACGCVPTDMKATECGVCGQFRIWRI